MLSGKNANESLVCSRDILYLSHKDHLLPMLFQLFGLIDVALGGLLRSFDNPCGTGEDLAWPSRVSAPDTLFGFTHAFLCLWSLKDK